MDRDQEDNERRRFPRVSDRGLPGPDRAPPADKFDPAEFAGVPEPQPSAAERTRGTADFAQLFKLISALETGMQRILTNFGMFRDIFADVRASVTEATAAAAKRAEDEAARDKIITARLIDPERLGAYAGAGAKAGVKEAIGETVARLERKIDADAQARELQSRKDAEARDLLSKQIGADQTERRTDELGRRRRDRWWNAGLLACALLIPAAYGYGRYGGTQDGEKWGYTRSRDEVAAANWANTVNGKLAHQLDQASAATIPLIADCSGQGWNKTTQDGKRVCFAAPTTTGWYRP